MSEKKIKIMWCISLLVISVVTLIWAGTSIIGLRLSDIMIRILGILDLISIPVLVYTSKKKKK